MALRVFSWAEKQKDYSHKLECYVLLVEIWASTGDLEGVQALGSEIRDGDFLLIVPACQSMIGSLGILGMVEKLIRVWCRRKEGEIEPILFLYNYLLDVSVNSVFLRSVVKGFEAMNTNLSTTDTEIRQRAIIALRQSSQKHYREVPAANSDLNYIGLRMENIIQQLNYTVVGENIIRGFVHCHIVVIANNVGVNVGFIAGRGSNLFGSYGHFSAMTYPRIISSMGIVVCLLTTLFATDFFKVKTVDQIEHSLERQLLISTTLMTVGIAIVSYIALPSNFTLYDFRVQKPIKNCHLFFCVAIGLWAGFIISDNAGGIAEMAGMCPKIRERTYALDAAGNTIAAIGKGLAIVSAALVSLALFDTLVSRAEIMIFAVLTPKVFIGLIDGAMLPYWFTAMTMKSVGSVAFTMVEEVRGQFNTISGLMERREKQNYATCVQISPDDSLKEINPPGALSGFAEYLKIFELFDLDVFTAATKQ